MKFKIEQIALAPMLTSAAKELLAEIGIGHWTEDHVVANGYVRGTPGRNEADLSFNYTALEDAKELEVLNYTDGPNWIKHFDGVSHFGMHVTPEELMLWRRFFLERRIPIAQEVFTESHTNEFLVNNGRKYNYVIFDTRSLIGVDLKFIVRID